MNILLKTTAVAARLPDSSEKSKNSAHDRVDHGWSLFLCSLDLTGAQATGADVNRLRATIYDRLYAADVRLPGSIRKRMKIIITN